MNGYAALHPLPMKVRADVLEIAAGYTVEDCERELAFALEAADPDDTRTLEWLAVVIDRRIADLEAVATA